MTIFGALQFIAGIILLCLSRTELRLGWASRRWPQTTGRICGSIVHQGMNQEISNDGTMAPVNRRFKEIDFVYRYAVMNQTYESSQFDFSAMGWHDSTHYVDDEVAVYYCPTDPSVAVLRPGVHVTLLIGPLFTFLGIGILAYGICHL